MDLNKMVMDSLAKMEAEGKVQAIIDKQIESTVHEIVKDVFGSWSDFSKSLKTNVKESLNINFKKLNLNSYNHLIYKAIQDLLDDQVVNEGVNSIKQQIEGLLLGEKRAYKLSELVKELSEEIEDLHELGYDECHEMTLYVDGSYGSTWIALDAKSDVREYDCKYRFLVNSEGLISNVSINDKQYHRTKLINEFDIKSVMSGLSGLEGTLFKMYVSGAKLEIDENECELEFSNPEYEN